MSTMRQLWQRVVAGGFVCLFGMSWLAIRFDFSITAFGWARLGGMVLCVLVAAWAAHRELREKWPAAVALICAAPVAADSLDGIQYLPHYFRTIGLQMMCIVGGSAFVIVTTVRILRRKLPPVDPPIAPARVVDES